MDFWFPVIFWGMGAVGVLLAALVGYLEYKEELEETKRYPTSLYGDL